MSIEFKDNSIEVKNRLNNLCMAWLDEAGGELTSQTQRNSKVDSGQTKGAWKYVVDESKQTATVGNPLENALYEEFGTGEYALNGDGRKTPWSYQDEKGQWHYTRGKHPTRMLFKAFTSLKKPLQQVLETKLKEGMK